MPFFKDGFFKSEETLPRYTSGPLARPYKTATNYSGFVAEPPRKETPEQQLERIQKMLDEGVKRQRDPNDGKSLPKMSLKEHKAYLEGLLNDGEARHKKMPEKKNEPARQASTPRKKPSLIEVEPKAPAKEGLGFFKRLGLRSAASVFMIIGAVPYDMPSTSTDQSNNVSSYDTKILHATRLHKHKDKAAVANTAWLEKNSRLKDIPQYQKLKEHFMAAEKTTGILQSFLAFTVPHEAREYNTHAVNSGTNACGLMQIKPEFFNYVYYEFLKNPEGLVRKVSDRKYIPAGNNDAEKNKNGQKLASMCKWPGLNLKSAGYNISVNMKSGLKTVLTYREPTFTDLYFIQVLGGKGADETVLKPYSDPLKWDHSISYYASEAVINANPLVFKNTDGSIKTVRQTYNDAIERVTYKALPEDLWKHLKKNDQEVHAIPTKGGETFYALIPAAGQTNRTPGPELG